MLEQNLRRRNTPHHFVRIQVFLIGIKQPGLALFMERGTAWGISWALISLGDVALDQGDTAGATYFFQDALDLFRRACNRLMSGWAQISLGRIAYMQGDLMRALSLLEESLALFRALDYRDGVAQVLLDLARVARAGRHYRGDGVRRGKPDAIRGDRESAIYCLMPGGVGRGRCRKRSVQARRAAVWGRYGPARVRQLPAFASDAR
jgi:hypothetical protein